MSTIRFIGVAGCALALSVAIVRADDKEKKTPIDASKLPPAATQAGVTYAKDIQPMFDKSCYLCHGPKAKKPQGAGGLRLDTLAAALKGGEDGVVIVPGDSAKSSLVAAVAHVGDEDDFMPPPKNKAHLAPWTKEQVGLVRAWIDQGAK
ncbi:MAG TPA: c-type cytochrome domain-containing protein [Verrucomicrobiae bacterium]|jgi:mono/diheme cytochrome c family protein|nr:c-type cytochrome domain-containing protein [Verrucomicrobiae bacterium]